MSSAASQILKLPIRNIRRINKYGAKGITLDGHRFPSQKEGRRYLQLKLLQTNGEIQDLELQVVYRLEVNGILICKYYADFKYKEYRNRIWTERVEDCKGFATPVYKLKRKLMKACHGIDLVET